MAAQVRVGTSGWIYRHWRGVFYPEKLPVARWFDWYARTFDTVEVNNSFYRLPSEEVFRDWGKMAPPGFLFAVKASRYLTHLKKLKDPEAPLENFLGRARKLGRRLGPVLYQLPPHWRCDPARLATFLKLLPHDVQHAVEFRDPSWYTDRVRELLTEAGVGFCIHDMHESPAPLWVTGPLVYVRFHGPTAVHYAGKYDRRRLRTWAERIRGFHGDGRDVFVYFNNDGGGHAVTNARQLRELLARAPAAV